MRKNTIVACFRKLGLFYNNKVVRFELMLKTARFSLVEAILPVVLVFGAKYISVFVIALLLSLEWAVGFSLSQIFTLPFIQFSNSADLLLVNSVSSLFMTMILTVGYAAALYRFQYFHENFIEPKVAARVHARNMEYLIFKETQAHSQITVWFILSWIVFLLILLEFLAGSAVLFVLVANFIITLLLGSAIVFDMHKKATTLRAKRR